MSSSRRHQKGISLVEFSAACVVGVPAIMVVLYVILEINYLFTIRTNLDVACRRAAQLLVTAYYNNNNVIPYADAANTTLPNTLAFDIKTADGHYIVNRNANQFTWTWSIANPPDSPRPSTVTVTVNYPNGGDAPNSIMPFPFPDPLNLGSVIGFNGIHATATFPIAYP